MQSLLHTVDTVNPCCTKYMFMRRGGSVVAHLTKLCGSLGSNPSSSKLCLFTVIWWAVNSDATLLYFGLAFEWRQRYTHL
jgi:hypothetical protein